MHHQNKALERMPGIAELRQPQRRDHARRRVRVGHGITHLNNRRSLVRHLGRRNTLDSTIRAAAVLLSDHQHTERPMPVAALTTGPTA